MALVAAPQPVRLFFTVDVEDLENDAAIFVVGSVPELGDWDPQAAMALLKCPEYDHRWQGSIETCASEVRFRYFTAYKLTTEGSESLIISRWEASIQPRICVLKLSVHEGQARVNLVDIFGFFAGRRQISDGWLQFQNENEVFLRLHGNALKFYNKMERKNCRVKCTPLDVRQKMAPLGTLPTTAPNVVEEEDFGEDDDAANNKSHSSSLVAALSSDKSKFQEQKDLGATFNNGKDYLVFKTHSIAVDYLAFLLEVFSEEGKRIGACYAMPASLENTFGHVGLPVVNSQLRPIGQIMLEYLFVRNLRRDHPPQHMELSFCRHWKKRNAIEVGHRGMGESYTKLAAARENTISSLNQAARNGADFVEFDVQLTKDMKAVIYHDFHVLVSVSKRVYSRIDLNNLSEDELKQLDFHEMALKDLKLNQLKLLMMNHLNYGNVNAKKLVADDSEEADNRPFPLLADALSRVDPDVGFNIEVKYPMMQADGVHECSNYFERNEFVDIILADVLKHAGNRRIMFSSFDPDICSLIALKQNRYPCCFLCLGDTQRYVPFTDQRTSTSMTAVNFASGIDLLGVNFNSEDLLKDPTPVRRASQLGLVTFVWGEDLNRKDVCHYFKRELGVDGVIYDRIGEEERRRNVFTVEREMKKVLFKLENLESGGSSPRTRSPEATSDIFDRSTDALFKEFSAQSSRSTSSPPQVSPPSPPLFNNNNPTLQLLKS